MEETANEHSLTGLDEAVSVKTFDYGVITNSEVELERLVLAL